MARSRLFVATFCLFGLFSLAGPGEVAFGQAADEERSGSQRRPPPPPNIKPIPSPQPAPMPPVGGRPPPPSSRPPANPPPQRDSPPRNPPRDPSPDTDNTSPGDAIDHARDLQDESRRRHGLDSPGDGDRRRDNEDDWRRRRYRRPWYYDHWRYDRHPGYYDDGYRGYDPQPPVDREPTEPPGGGAADPGGLLPPDDLMDEDIPANLRRALEASPQYREATAQLLRAWAAYARAAEQVLLQLRPNPAYRKALADLRAAEAKVAAIRDRGGNVPAVNLVTAAQEAMLARRAVRAQEEKAVDADPVARRARQQVDEAIERRNKIRDDIAAKLPEQDR